MTSLHLEVKEMKSLVVDSKGNLSIEQLSMPTYNEYQALVKMRSCGVCNGTDTKIIQGEFKNFDTYPAVLGHEGVGEVVEIGKHVTKYKVGDIVLLPFLEQPIDGYYSGWGAFSEYAVVGDAEAYIRHGKGPGTEDFSEGYFAQSIIHPEDKVDPVGASMIITLREVLSACYRFDVGRNKNILIFGAGPVGLSFAKFAKLLGAQTVMVTDISDEKVSAAYDFGADHAWNSTVVDINKEVLEMFPDGVDMVIDAVGINQLINQAMSLVKYNGDICCYGISPKLGMDLDWSDAPYNWNLKFVQWPSKKEEAEAHNQIMAWINMGVLNPMDYISDVFSFDKVLDAFELLDKKLSDTKKIIIEF